MTVAAVIGVAVATLARGRLGDRQAVAIGALAAAIVLVPALLALGVVGAALVMARRRHAIRRGGDGDDVTLVAELTALGLSAGLSFQEALGAAAALTGGRIETEVRAVVRRGTRAGLSGELEMASGLARDLYRLAGRALRTGAPVRVAVQAHVDQLRAEERARALERARKLPVKMLFPLALLILPGFLILTVGPTLLGALDRLRM